MRVPGIPYIQGRNSYTDADGTKYGIAIHNTSNDASARNEAAYAQNRTDGVSSHFYVDRIEVIQSLDLLARAGHAGSKNGNENGIAVEITGVNGWSRSTWLANVNWVVLGSTLAWCCNQFGIAVRRASVSEMRSNPKVRAFYSHDDMRQAWGGTDHTDPGPNFPWDKLFEVVAGGSPPLSTTDPIPTKGGGGEMAVIKNKSTGAHWALAGVGGAGSGEGNWMETEDGEIALQMLSQCGPSAKFIEVYQGSWDKWKAACTGPAQITTGDDEEPESPST